jgi:hypothetical protein
VRRKLGDRRIRPRYDVVGDLWGTLETVLPLTLKNVGPGGALLESHVPLAAESVHRLTFSWSGHERPARVRVRHVAPAISPAGQSYYAIGVEFVGVHPALAAEIERQVSAAHPGSVVAEA